MAKLPQRPIFTNWDDGSPNFKAARQNPNRCSRNPKNSPNPRAYHPYDRRPSASVTSSPIPPWKFRPSHRQNQHFGLPGSHEHGQVRGPAMLTGSYQLPYSYPRGYAPPPHPTPPSYAGSNNSRNTPAMAMMGDSNQSRANATPDYAASASAMSLSPLPSPTHSPTAPPNPKNGGGWNMAAYSPPGHRRGAPSLVQVYSHTPIQHRESVSRCASPMMTSPPRAFPATASNTAGSQAGDVMSIGSSARQQEQYLPSPESMGCHSASSQTSAQTMIYRNQNNHDSDPALASNRAADPAVTFTMNDRNLFLNLSAAANQPSRFTNPPSDISIDQSTMGQPSNDEVMRDSAETEESDMTMQNPPNNGDSDSINTITISPPPPTPTATADATSSIAVSANADPNYKAQRQTGLPTPNLGGSLAVESTTTEDNNQEIHNQHLLDNNNNPTPPIALSNTATTTLHLTLHNTTRTLLINPSVLRIFSGLSLPSDSATLDSYIIDLTPSLSPFPSSTTLPSFSLSAPASSSSPPSLHPSSSSSSPSSSSSSTTSALISPATHLTALQRFLTVLHSPDTASQHILDVDTVWRLGTMNAVLGIGGVWVEWMRRGTMGLFVRAVGGQGGGGPELGSGLGGLNLDLDLDLDLEEGLRDLEFGGDCADTRSEWCDKGRGRGRMRTPARWEKALGACVAFGWVDEFRVLAARLAYLCSVGEDPETGEVRLVKPDGGWVEAGVCRGRVVDIILAARRQILPELFITAQQSLSSWVARIGSRPCENIHCSTNRIAALNAFLLQSGLFPRTRLDDKSIHEIVSALKYITATDNELVTAAKENKGLGDCVARKLVWAANIRETYGITCTKCHEKTATSSLFPLEDLLTDLTWGLHEHLLGVTEFPHLPLHPFGVSAPVGPG